MDSLLNKKKKGNQNKSTENRDDAERRTFHRVTIDILRELRENMILIKQKGDAILT